MTASALLKVRKSHKWAAHEALMSCTCPTVLGVLDARLCTDAVVTRKANFCLGPQEGPLQLSSVQLRMQPSLGGSSAGQMLMQQVLP